MSVQKIRKYSSMSRSNGPPQLPPQLLDTQHSRAGMPCSTASPVGVILSRNELQHKVELSTGVKPCSPVLALQVTAVPALSAALPGEHSWFLHALFKASSLILNAFGEMPV